MGSRIYVGGKARTKHAYLYTRKCECTTRVLGEFCAGCGTKHRAITRDDIIEHYRTTRDTYKASLAPATEDETGVALEARKATRIPLYRKWMEWHRLALLIDGMACTCTPDDDPPPPFTAKHPHGGCWAHGSRRRGGYEGEDPPIHQWCYEEEPPMTDWPEDMKHITNGIPKYFYLKD